MGGNNKFFFEEDVEEIGSGVTTDEQADIFGEAVAEMGITSPLDSMAPKNVELIQNDVNKIETPMLTIEYGIVGKDYVLHITPTHPQRNLQDGNKLNSAIKEIIYELNTVVPFDLRVDIHLPQPDWEVKATSFIVRDAANAWNFSREEMDNEVVPEIERKVSAICVKL